MDPDSSRQGQAQESNLDLGLWTLNFFYGLRMTSGFYQQDHSLSQRLLKHFFDNVLLEHVGLIHVYVFSLLLMGKMGNWVIGKLSFLAQTGAQ